MVDAVLDDFRTAAISEKDRALFTFIEKVNRVSNQIDATGVADMPAELYEMSGERLATRGYTPPPPPSP